MKKTNNNLIMLIVLFVSSLITSNLISSNGMIFTNIFLTENIQLLAPGAVLAYACTFLCTDVIGQIWGKEEANLAVMCGLIGQIVCTALIAITPIIFRPWFVGSDVYATLNGLGWFTVGSLVAYCVSQTWDVYVFHAIKGWAQLRMGDDKYNKQRWLWNNGSTMTSQIFDTIIFIGIGFGVGQKMPVGSLIGLMIGQYCIKFCLALLDTPIFYVLTHTKKTEGEE